MLKITNISTKKELTEIFKQQLSTRPNVAIKGLLRIYENQTDEETESMLTKVDNGVGFTGTDATILTSLAQQYKERGSLSPKQMNVLFKLMPKYANQLLSISFSKELIKKIGKYYAMYVDDKYALSTK